MAQDANNTVIAARLAELGLVNPGRVHWNLPPAWLVEHALTRREGLLADTGALVVRTGKRTGRSPRDRFVVRDAVTESTVGWGAVNRPLDPTIFQRLFSKVTAYLQGRELFVFDGWAGADPFYRLGVRVITEKAWHCLFARTLFLRLSPGETMHDKPGFTVICASDLHCNPEHDQTNSETLIALDFAHRLVLILGTQYGGEIKKSIFSVLNFLLPERGVFPMHCSANMGPHGDTALFFGLSGTGKTTLSADPNRRLIGDDEHGWSDQGVFNFEGGCYAKTIRLSREGEPQIWNAIRFGSVLENVVVDPHTRKPDFDDDSITENTRATYPVEHIDNAETSGQGGHPRNLIFLTCDAFGVLPPVSRLSHEQAVYYFLSGYTAKVAGTEAGVTEPEATFSTCFGAPFMLLPPTRYGAMLKARLARHGPPVWLINTGWSGGPAGQAKRIPLRYTRAMVTAVLNGQLARGAFVRDPVFGLEVPEACPDVPDGILLPRSAWRDPSDYDAKAKRLVELFEQNIQRYSQDAFVGAMSETG